MKHFSPPNKNNQEQGFSLVEVMIASIILFIILASANKALMLGMASTRRGVDRTTIETQILNDIETIQGIDSQLSSERNVGCDSVNGGSKYLESQIKAYDIRNPPAQKYNWRREMDSTDLTMLTITYIFGIPESTQNNAGTTITPEEKRVLEISPSFLSECTT